MYTVVSNYFEKYYALSATNTSTVFKPNLF